MEKSIAMVLEQLSNKLGTTVEHLWSVLVKQATVDAVINIVCIIIVAALGVLLYKLHKKFSKETKPQEESYTSTEYERHESTAIIMGISTAVWAIIAIVMFFCLIPETITALVNPEYTALKNVLTMLSGGCN